MWTLILGSLALTFLSPLGLLKERIVDNLPWVATGALISESLFTIGLAIIAADVGVKLGRNPLQWRQKLLPMLRQATKGKLFWVGFWVNTVGALGSGLIVGTGIVLTFPPQSWGLVIIPFLDLSLTIAIRTAAIEWAHGEIS